jgi:hypothetical protein
VSVVSGSSTCEVQSVCRRVAAPRPDTGHTHHRAGERDAKNPRGARRLDDGSRHRSAEAWQGRWSLGCPARSSGPTLKSRAAWIFGRPTAPPGVLSGCPGRGLLASTGDRWRPDGVSSNRPDVKPRHPDPHTVVVSNLDATSSRQGGRDRPR